MKQNSQGEGLIALIMPLPHLLQESVEVWLRLIGLTQYEQELIDAGYDDIDFISDISSEELEDIGVSKKGGCGTGGWGRA